MKVIQYMLFSLLLLPFATYAQSNEQFYNELSKAMGSGNTSLLTRLFHEEINITNNGKEGSYNPDQAGALLLQFFRENRPLTFNLKHKGASADGQVYMIGQLETQGGQQFRIVCRAKNLPSGYRVFKLDVEGAY